MNNQDYEKAKEECWSALFNSIVPSKDAYTVALYFPMIFDRAYRLGMEAAKKEMLIANIDSSAPNVESLGEHTPKPKYHVG